MKKIVDLLYISVTFIIISALSGCAYQDHFIRSDIHPLNTASGSANGVMKAISDKTTDEPVIMLFVHGMRTTQKGYSAKVQTGVIKELQKNGFDMEFIASESIKIERDGDNDDFADAPQSEIIRSTWSKTQTNADGSKAKKPVLIVYELDWFPLRDYLKGKWIKSETNRYTNGYFDKGVINDYIQQQVLIDGFSDAEIVVNSFYGEPLREDILTTMRIIAIDKIYYPAQIPFDNYESYTGYKDKGINIDTKKGSFNDIGKLEGTKFFIITYSLGSFLVFDTHQQYTDKVDDENLAGRLFNKSTIYMLANQISILQLTRYSKTMPTVGSKEITYVAFNDINDMLNFPLISSIAEKNHSSFVNVDARNPAFYIPLIFKDPLTHVKYDDNNAVIEAIVYGIEWDTPTPSQKLPVHSSPKH